MNKKNILFLTFRFPYPLRDGCIVKSYHLLIHLAKTHNVHLITLISNKKSFTESKKHLEEQNIKVHSFNLSNFNRLLNVFKGLFSETPLEVLWYMDKNFRSEIDKVLKKENIDITFAFYMRTGEYIKHLDIKKVLIAEDCRTTYQNRSFKASKFLPQRIIRWFEYIKLKKYEPKMLGLFDICTCVTQLEINDMQELNPKANMRLLTNGTNVDYYNGENRNNPDKLLFLGNLRLWANQLMIRKIVEIYLPEIINKHPDIKFQIIGANATNWIKNLESKNIEIFENVKDISVYHKQCLVFLHPHSGATGIQNKLLEAMSSECPIVSTTTGVQGLNVENGKHLYIAQNDTEFINYTLELIENKKLGIEMGKLSRELILQSNTWKIVGESLDKIIEELE